MKMLLKTEETAKRKLKETKKLAHQMRKTRKQEAKKKRQ